jgi:hypothetical protein
MVGEFAPAAAQIGLEMRRTSSTVTTLAMLCLAGITEMARYVPGMGENEVYGMKDPEALKEQDDKGQQDGNSSKHVPSRRGRMARPRMYEFGVDRSEIQETI